MKLFWTFNLLVALAILAFTSADFPLDETEASRFATGDPSDHYRAEQLNPVLDQKSKSDHEDYEPTEEEKVADESEELGLDLDSTSVESAVDRADTDEDREDGDELTAEIDAWVNARKEFSSLRLRRSPVRGSARRPSSSRRTSHRTSGHRRRGSPSRRRGHRTRVSTSPRTSSRHRTRTSSRSRSPGRRRTLPSTGSRTSAGQRAGISSRARPRTSAGGSTLSTRTSSGTRGVGTRSRAERYRSVNNLLSRTTTANRTPPTDRNGMTETQNYFSRGSFQDALRDFNALRGDMSSASAIFRNQHQWQTRVGHLRDGRTVVARSSSTYNGWPTLEIQQRAAGANPRFNQKIRYTGSSIPSVSGTNRGGA